ncbi:MAG: CheR family methyltransferase, partial [Desulfuromonadales bacterium]|nr:CheR family methyltransferase [Desulfuromonadales bacterium]
EAYSLAIICHEAISEIKPKADFKLQIFATDLDQDAIDKARRGWYPSNIAADVSADRLRRFFVQEENGYRIGKKIREMVTFATQNVIMDPPFTKLDILVCRNLLIYLMPELQKKLLPLFHYSLKPDGVLFLGNAEAIGTAAELFAPINLKLRLFRRRESVLPASPVDFPASFAPARAEGAKESIKVKAAANLQSLADELLLQHFSPPAVLVNDQGDILYISGRTGKYLEPAAGKANWNIFAMARQGLNFDLGVAFHKVLRQKEAITLKGLKIGTEGGSQTLDVTLKTIEEPEALRGMVMIVFHDVSEPPPKKTRGHTAGSDAAIARVAELEQEVQKLREELHTTREEMQSSQEELKSTNEELQSANEELQSTNEELTTSKEEMQSLNEELQTVNAEQQSKMDELARTEDDLRNLLNSTEIMTIFLDNDLHVRRFTEGAQKIFKLIPGDVGRPLSDIASDLLYPEMAKDTKAVLRTLAFSEKEIATEDGRWFSVRIMPYRTIDDVIGGVVITFANITGAKALEKELREHIEQLKHQPKGGA